MSLAKYTVRRQVYCMAFLYIVTYCKYVQFLYVSMSCHVVHSHHRVWEWTETQERDGQSPGRDQWQVSLLSGYNNVYCVMETSMGANFHTLFTNTHFAGPYSPPYCKSNYHYIIHPESTVHQGLTTKRKELGQECELDLRECGCHVLLITFSKFGP